MSQLRALVLLRSNIEDLLMVRKESQSSLAAALQKDRSWINKFLNGDREIQLKDLDAIAAFFGIHTYQLFQPGISRLTERRRGVERRSGKDRRIGHAQRTMQQIAGHIEAVRRDAPPSASVQTQLRKLTAEFETRVADLLSTAQSRRQGAGAAAKKPGARKGARTTGGPDAPKTGTEE